MIRRKTILLLGLFAQRALQNRVLRSMVMGVILMLSGQVAAADQDSADSKHFVGMDVCVDCHQSQVQAWQGSHHQKAMLPASAESVLASFDDVILPQQAVSSQSTSSQSTSFQTKSSQSTSSQTTSLQQPSFRFFQQEDQYWVEIFEPNQAARQYQVLYTFGWYPLQQYMVELSNGHKQLLPWVWDSRTSEEGGQRWFNLYPNLTPSDEFYWTNAGQNWNAMCADCHSTNLEKNYQPETDRYQTTWSEINVSCEACHGPASRHVALMRKDVMSQDVLSQNGESSSAASHDAAISRDVGHSKDWGFSLDLGKAVVEWVQKDNASALPSAKSTQLSSSKSASSKSSSTKSSLTKPSPNKLRTTQQLQTCAQCHSRRTQFHDQPSDGSSNFLDKYRLNLISSELYQTDGQILDEVYVYGSFLQSKMAKKGVTCTNCHDPHSAKLVLPEPALCTQCHQANQYQAETHSRHAKQSDADQCTSCHMPETVYMQVDPRRDHRFSVPRPDLSQYTGTSNVCTDCHQNRTNQWAAETLKTWFPNSQYQLHQDPAIAFYANSINHRDAADALAYTAQDQAVSDILRASALERMAGNQGQNTVVALARAVRHDNALIRLGAIEGSSGYAFQDRWQMLQPLLSDPIRAIRTDAAAALVPHYSEMNLIQREALAPPLSEYVEIQRFNADRGFGRVNLANVERAMGNYEQAILLYQQAITIEPYFEQSYINLADLYRSRGEEQQAVTILQQGLVAQPKSSALPFSIGLTLIRLQQVETGQTYLLQAARQAQTEPHYWYVYGLAIEQSNVLAASAALDSAYQLSANPQHLYARCEVLGRNLSRGEIETQWRGCMEQLAAIAPPQVVQQLEQQISVK